MAKKIVKKTASEIYPKAFLAFAIRYSPYWIPLITILIFWIVIFTPLQSKISKINQKIQEFENSITTVERSKFDIQKNREDLKNFKLKVEEFEKRLPVRLKTKLIIETLQEITKQADLKFSSLKPESIKKYVLEKTNDVFVELPVNIKMRCSYFELIEFLKKIEMAKQLMKISNLSIRSDPAQEWEHMVEFSVSTFSKGEGDEQ